MTNIFMKCIYLFVTCMLQTMVNTTDHYRSMDMATDMGNELYTAGNLSMVAGTTISSTVHPTVFLYIDQIIELKIKQIMAPIVLLVGIVGNILAFMVFSRPGMRESVNSIFFRALAVCDFIELLKISEYVFFLFNLETTAVNTPVCCITTFLIKGASACSAWCLVLISAERFIGVIFPHMAKVWITKGRARIALAVTLISVLALHAPILAMYYSKWKFVVEENKWRRSCSKTGKYVSAYREIFPWLEVAMYSFIPFILILLLNIGIGIRLIQAARRRRSLSTEGSNDQRLTGTTAMLLLTSFCFVILTLPKTSYNLLKDLIGFSSDDPGRSLYIRLRPVKAAAMIMQQSNHAVNFLLYCISGRKFRTELMNMLRGNKGERSQGSTSGSTRKT